MVLAWRIELAGGLLTIASLVAFYLTLFVLDMRFPGGPGFFLAASPGLLFLASWAVGRVAEEEQSTGATEADESPRGGDPSLL